jgi:hypothetical protein
MIDFGKLSISMIRAIPLHLLSARHSDGWIVPNSTAPVKSPLERFSRCRRSFPEAAERS